MLAMATHNAEKELRELMMQQEPLRWSCCYGFKKSLNYPDCPGGSNVSITPIYPGAEPGCRHGGL